MLDGVSLRYQVRSPRPNIGPWCLTGHSVFVVGGELVRSSPSHRPRMDPNSFENDDCLLKPMVFD